MSASDIKSRRKELDQAYLVFSNKTIRPYILLGHDVLELISTHTEENTTTNHRT